MDKENPSLSIEEKMNIGNHLTAVSNQKASDEIPARPADPSAVYPSLAGNEEEGSFAEAVNG